MHCARTFCYWIIIAGVAVCIANNYRQERAVIAYFNPKYIRSAQAFTGRARRGEPYRTNLTADIKQSWTNNVTIEISYLAKSSPMPLAISFKYCDIMKTKWMVDFVNAYSRPKIVCPLPAGTVSFINMELPPKNFPLPIPKGDIRVNWTSYITDTKELMILTTMLLHSN